MGLSGDLVIWEFTMVKLQFRTPRFLYLYVLMERAALYKAIHYAHLRVRCVYITIAGRSHAGQLQGNYRWKEEMKGFFLVQSMQKFDKKSLCYKDLSEARSRGEIC